MSCVICGRRMPVKKNRRPGDTPQKFCSAACRKMRLGADDEALEQLICALLKERGHGKTICPSEAARRHFGDAGLKPERMEQTRRAARRLVAAGVIEIMQRGHIVDPSTARGPIRLRLCSGH